MKYLLLILTLSFHKISLAAPIRTVQLTSDQILNINTALGIATIIQLQETIQSIIIGDQSGFKVEPLDKAITIKPLRWGAKTNLYLVTEKQRYNLKLHTDKQEIADFIVYVQTVKDESNILWRTFEKKFQVNSLTFELLKIGKSKSGFILLSGRIRSKESQTIKPEQFWIYQGNQSKVINGLYLSNTSIAPRSYLDFGVSLALSDLEEKKLIIMELKSNPNLTLVIPADVLWK